MDEFGLKTELVNGSGEINCRFNTFVVELSIANDTEVLTLEAEVALLFVINGDIEIVVVEDLVLLHSHAECGALKARALCVGLVKSKLESSKGFEHALISLVEEGTEHLRVELQAQGVLNLVGHCCSSKGKHRGDALDRKRHYIHFKVLLYTESCQIIMANTTHLI